MGGGVFGALVAFFSSVPFFASALIGAVVGAFIWTTLSLALETVGRRRHSYFAGLVRLAYGLVAIIYLLAAVVLIGMIVYVKTNIPAHGPADRSDYIAPAKIN